MAKVGQKVRYSVSLVTQGKHRFYTLTIPSDVLAKCCFTSLRDEDPKEGFQRRLDRKRAEEIADYIDNDFGTIPNSVILSAQPAAEFSVVGSGKTVEFKVDPKAFLIIDGQHRVYGFHLAKTTLRIPVVVYNGLKRSEEARLFIDVNTKQKPVPTELLLDIKRLAEAESDSEALLKDVFDLFDESNDSALLGLTSSASRSRGKISRVTFNSALKPVVAIFAEPDADGVYKAVNSYLHAVKKGLSKLKVERTVSEPVVFKAFMALFRDVAQKSRDRFGRKFSAENFLDVLSPVFSRLPAKQFSSPGSSYKDLYALMQAQLGKDFLI